MIGRFSFNSLKTDRYLHRTRARIASAFPMTVPTTASCRVIGALVTLLSGCQTGEPAWAMDVIHVVPEGDLVQVLQTWSLFDERWERQQRGSRLVCTVLRVMEGTPTEPCDGCAVSWEVVQTRRDSDCPLEARGEHAVIGDLAAVGISDKPAADSPVEGARTGFVRYPDGWQTHGHAWPEGAPEGRAATGRWDGERPFELWPAFAWDLAGGGPESL